MRGCAAFLRQTAASQNKYRQNSRNQHSSSELPWQPHQDDAGRTWDIPTFPLCMPLHLHPSLYKWGNLCFSLF